MSLFFTAPPIYNTGGFNTYYSGFGYSFNPTGLAPDTLESGSSDLTISSEYYYSRSLYFDFKKELTLNHAANEVGKAYLQGLPAINFAYNSADKFGNFKVANANYFFSLSPKTKNYNTVAGLSRTAYSFHRFDYEHELTLNYLLNLKRANTHNTFSSSHVYRLKNKIAKRADTSMNYFAIFPHLEVKNYLTFGIKHLVSPDSQLAKRVDMSMSYARILQKEIHSRSLPNISLAKSAKIDIGGTKKLNTVDYPLSFEKIKKSYEVGLSHAPHSFHRTKIGNSPDLTDYYLTKLERTRDFLNIGLIDYPYNRLLYTSRNDIYASFNYRSKKIGQLKSLRDLSLNYKKRETTNLAFSKTMGLSYIKRWEVLAGLGYQRNRSLIGPITYHDIDFSRGSFSSSNRLDTTEYLYQDKERAIGTKSSFPTGLEFPKVRYSTVEPDFTRAATGSASHGVLVYEGIAAGNLFYYEPDQDSFKWGYFDYGIRSGIFNPCEFPETADRTLDPIQISSKSNKLDNPFWYLPDLLTVDSTIHTADGAPCQYIAQENSRFAGIYLTQSDSQLASDPVYLFPENFTQTGAAFTI